MAVVLRAVVEMAALRGLAVATMAAAWEVPQVALMVGSGAGSRVEVRVVAARVVEARETVEKVVAMKGAGWAMVMAAALEGVHRVVAALEVAA